MLKSIKRAFYAKMARYDCRNEDFAKARTWLRKMEEIAHLSPFERAFEARIFHMTRDFDEAERRLEEVLAAPEQAETTLDVYVRNFCLATLYNMRGQFHLEHEPQRLMAEADVRPVVRDWLPNVGPSGIVVDHQSQTSDTVH